MAEPFTVQKWRASDGTLHDTEAEAREHEARMRLIARTDAVLRQLGLLTEPPGKSSPRPPYYVEDDFQRVARASFDSGARTAIEAAIKAGLIKGEG